MIIFLCSPFPNDLDFNGSLLNEVTEILKKDNHEIFNPNELFNTHKNKSNKFYSDRLIKTILNSDIDLLILMSNEWKKNENMVLQMKAAKEKGLVGGYSIKELDELLKKGKYKDDGSRVKKVK